MKQVFKDEQFRQALQLASPVMSERLEKAGREPDQLSEKELLTLKKYFNRMCFRPTPFGGFSAFAPARWGASGNLSIHSPVLHLHHSFEQLMRVAKGGKKASSKRRYQVNPSRYTVAGETRFLTAAPDDAGKGREFSVMAIEHSELIGQLGAIQTALTAGEWIKRVCQTGEETATAADFVRKLVSLQFLVGDRMPRTVGEENLEATSGVAVKDMYANLSAQTSGTLDDSLQQTLLEGLKMLNGLSLRIHRSDAMERFTRDFTRRFPGEAVSLMVALDPEAGVGYQDLTQYENGKELIHGLQWPAQPVRQHLPWSPVHQLLLNRWHAASGGTLSLTSEDLDALPAVPERTSPSLSLLFRPLDCGKLWIESAGGIGATALLGRFTKFSDEILEMARFVAEEEQRANPEVLFAEIDHVCNFHLANINRRAAIYDYKIPLMTSDTDGVAALPLSDLMVSIAGNEIVLFSKSCHKRVIPRLSSAFNYTKSNLAVFRFLCDLQHDGIATLQQFELSGFFPGLKRYPRVEYRDCVLSLATWHLTGTDLAPIRQATADSKSQRFHRWRKAHGLPRLVMLSVQDHYLVFDLRRAADCAFFLATIRESEAIVLREYLSQSQTPTACTDENGRRKVSQYLAMLYQKKTVYTDRALPVVSGSETRFRVPGSEWLYYKIYGHPLRFDELIVGLNRQIAEPLLRSGRICEWFFIRYQDPDPHIRFRLKIEPRHWGETSSSVNALLGRLLQEGRIADYAIAVYQQETERYGIREITAVERSFFYSSRLVAAYLETPLSGYESFAVHSIRRMIRHFGLNPQEQMSFLESRLDAFSAEFCIDRDFRRQANERYRQLAGNLAAAGNYSRQTNFYWLLFDRWLHRLAGQPTLPKFNLLGDLVHMHLNRLFSDEPRRQEYITYYLVWKFEKMLLGKERQGQFQEIVVS